MRSVRTEVAQVHPQIAMDAPINTVIFVLMFTGEKNKSEYWDLRLRDIWGTYSHKQKDIKSKEAEGSSPHFVSDTTNSGPHPKVPIPGF